MKASAGLLVASLVVSACGAKSQLIVPMPDVPAVPDAEAGIDAMDVPFVMPPDLCMDGAVTYIYVVTEQNDLFSYYPPTNAFTLVGRIDCPIGSGSSATPFSMAVDRGGTAYVVFNDGRLFRVSTANAACEPTGFMEDQHGFTTFGMGFVSDITDPGETLYVASTNFSGGVADLGSIDTMSFRLGVVSPFPSSVLEAELTGTGDGHLYAFSADVIGAAGTFIAEIDRTTAQVTQMWPLPTVSLGMGWAFAFWGGDFYVFTGETQSSVTRFRPSDGSVTVLRTMTDLIVGAGVSTCAPH